MKELSLVTADNINIAVNYYESGRDEMVIVAPGWCMTKDSDAFCRISKMLAKNFDVLCVDFRGHGKSSGRYTFTAKETLDIDAAVKYAQSKGYNKIHLAGFSLGAATSLIYAAKNPFISSIIAVSAPADFERIENQMWKKEAWGETFRKFELNRFLSIRPGSLFFHKIKPVEVIVDIKCPVLFIAGEKDPTVHTWHTRLLYEKAVCKKSFHLFKDGCHAEDLFLYFENEFGQLCLNWLISSAELQVI